MARRAWIVSAVVWTACFGGQTGEITDLTACHEPVGVRSVDEPGADGRSARDRIDAVATALEAEVAWQDGSTTLSMAYALSGSSGTLLGGPECAEPWLEAPVAMTVRTADGSLDETIVGVALLTGAETVSVSGSIRLSDLRGDLDLTSSSGDPNRDTLQVQLQSDRGALAGQIALHSGEDTTELASF